MTSSVYSNFSFFFFFFLFLIKCTFSRSNSAISIFASFLSGGPFSKKGICSHRSIFCHLRINLILEGISHSCKQTGNHDKSCYPLTKWQSNIYPLRYINTLPREINLTWKDLSSYIDKCGLVRFFKRKQITDTANSFLESTLYWEWDSSTRGALTILLKLSFF